MKRCHTAWKGPPAWGTQSCPVHPRNSSPCFTASAYFPICIRSSSRDYGVHLLFAEEHKIRTLLKHTYLLHIAVAVKRRCSLFRWGVPSALDASCRTQFERTSVEMMWHDDLNASSCAMHVTYHCTDGGAHAVEQRTAQYSPGFGELQWRGWNRLPSFRPPIDGLFPLSIRDSVGSTHQASKLANVDAPWKELWCKSDRSHVSAKYTKKRSFSWICCGYNEQKYKKDEGVHQEYKKEELERNRRRGRPTMEASSLLSILISEEVSAWRAAATGDRRRRRVPCQCRMRRRRGGRVSRQAAASGSLTQCQSSIRGQQTQSAQAPAAHSPAAWPHRVGGRGGRSFPSPNLDRVNRVNCL